VTRRQTDGEAVRRRQGLGFGRGRALLAGGGRWFLLRKKLWAAERQLGGGAQGPPGDDAVLDGPSGPGRMRRVHVTWMTPFLCFCQSPRSGGKTGWSEVEAFRGLLRQPADEIPCSDDGHAVLRPPPLGPASVNSQLPACSAGQVDDHAGPGFIGPPTISAVDEFRAAGLRGIPRQVV